VRARDGFDDADFHHDVDDDPLQPTLWQRDVL
jgi:hypothetical protein